MAVFVKAIPTFLMHVFVPVLGVCLAVWFFMLLISAISGKRHSCRFASALSGSGGSAASPRRDLGKAVWTGLISLAVACTLYSGKSPDGTNGVQNLPPQPMLQLPAPQQPLPQSPAPPPSILDYPRTVTDSRAAAGIALVGVGTNETFTFDPPANAVVCDDWRTYGSATRWTHVTPTNFAFPFGGTNVSTFTFVPGGVMYVTGGGPTAASNNVAPFRAKMGIAPERLWASIGVTSRLWTATSPSNTFLATWQGAFLGRNTNNPVDVQLELFPDGGFDCRYDLFRLVSDDLLYSVRVGAVSRGYGETYSVPHRNLTSARWRPVAPEDATDPDRDNDGVTTVDELFFLGTDPGNPDCDFDGLTDGQELTLGLNPLDPYSNGGLYSDGFATALGNENPLANPPDSSYTIYEHIVYSGTTNGAVSVPVSATSSAVLEVSASGTGTGDLVVGSRSIPLIGGAPTVYVPVPCGDRLAVRLRRRTGSLSLSLDSEDFAIGEMPDLMGGDPTGWISFPRTAPVPEVACIHDLYRRTVRVRLEPGYGEEDLSCHWWGTSAVAASNHADNLSATLTGNFDAHCTARVMYTLDHPLWLLGMGSCWQAVRFCPRPADADDEPEEEPDEGPWPGGPYADLWGGGDEDGRSGCDCCQSCALAGGGGGTVECHHHDGEAPPAVSGPVPEENPDDPPALCPVHGCPYSECADLHEDAAPRTVTVPDSTHVLKIGRIPTVSAVALAVPEGAVNCCPCPGHWTNYVGVAYQSPHLSVRDGGGFPFYRSEVDCTVYVTGVSPTHAAAGAPLAFVTNGTVSVRRDYAVLGVDIDTPNRTAARLNALNPMFGVPVTVCTNVARASGIDLVTRVRLAAGAVTLTADDGAFQAWLDRSGQGRPPLLLVDGESRPTVTMSLVKWRSLTGLTGEEDEARTRVLLTSATNGTRTLTFSFSAGGELNDAVVQRVTFVRPPLLVDYNRDGRIDFLDVASYLAGRLAYFWRNDDTWRYDDAFDASWVGLLGNLGLDDIRNSSNGTVDGRCDLINFLPVAVDVCAFVTNWNANAAYYRLEADSAGVQSSKIAFADVDWENVGEAPFGTDCDIHGNYLHAAPVSELGGGTNLPPAFVTRTLTGSSTLLMEFPFVARNGGLRLKVYSKADDALLFSTSIKLHVGDVSQMVGWSNLRSDAGGSGGVPTRLATPDWPPEAHEPGTVVFVHGYNMEEDDETPLWAQNVFKKLWWSGLDRGFVAVQWRGNEGQTAEVLTPNYYGNVQNAFQTAPALSNAMQEVQGPKWFVAHSLGNMLVSAAIQDYGMEYEKYFMLNAAVAMEAFDPTVGITQESHDKMTPEAWTNYTDRVRATHWFERFPEGDGRRLLTWKGRFANVTNIVNFYSTQEEVVNDGDGDWHPITVRNYVWYNQETRKGVWPLMLHEYEGGWAFNGYYNITTNYWIGNTQQTETYHMPPAEADQLPDAQLQQIPFFLDFHNPEMHSSSNGLIVATNYLYRAEMLAYAIPSESFATGAHSLPQLVASDLNFNMASEFAYGREDLPENGEKTTEMYRNWQHSTFVQRSYKRTHQLFKKIINLLKEGE